VKLELAGNLIDSVFESDKLSNLSEAIVCMNAFLNELDSENMDQHPYSSIWKVQLETIIELLEETN